jgi:hypothetical protein
LDSVDVVVVTSLTHESPPKKGEWRRTNRSGKNVLCEINQPRTPSGVVVDPDATYATDAREVERDYRGHGIVIDLKQLQLQTRIGAYGGLCYCASSANDLQIY